MRRGCDDTFYPMIFEQALVIADAHFGRNGNSPVANQDNSDFLKWAIDEARTWGAESCIMLGDWFHNRHQVGVATMHAALRGIEMLSDAFKRSWFLMGNHDCYFRERRDITSIEFAKHIPNIIVVNDPLIVEDTTFLPWLMPGEDKTLDLKSRYVFGHLELAGFLTNARYEMPESDHTQSPSSFANVGEVYSGHFHKRQFRKNITYVGNLMPFDFNDDGDADRGIMLLRHARDPQFRAWPHQPLFKSMKLSELVHDADRLLRQNMTVRAMIDLPLSYEESQEVKETLTRAYGLRKIEMFNGLTTANQDQDGQDDMPIHTVDQTVIEGLRSIQSIELSPQRLVEIYNSLVV